MRRGAAASLLVLLAACASTPASRGGEHFRCPARGGPAWHEATSAHFTVSGDLTPGEVRSLSRQLEEVRAAIVEGLFPGERRTVAGQARVVAFRSDEAFDEFAPPGLSAFLWPSGLGDHLIVMPARSGLDRRAVVAHELTHHVLRQAYPRQPRWFGEGYAALAEVLGGGHGLSGLRLHEKPIGPRQLERGESELSRKINEADDDDGFFTDPEVRTVRRFGRLPVELARIHAREPVPVRELLAWNGRVQDARLRASAAVLVHHLLHEEAPRFAAFRARLADAERPEVAWQVTFPEWDPRGRAVRRRSTSGSSRTRAGPATATGAWTCRCARTRWSARSARARSTACASPCRATTAAAAAGRRSSGPRSRRRCARTPITWSRSSRRPPRRAAIPSRSRGGRRRRTRATCARCSGSRSRSRATPRATRSASRSSAARSTPGPATRWRRGTSPGSS
ncbi:MAG: hypothetical protein QM704_03195 [Anaeromyxobacteraceae bacterium]